MGARFLDRDNQETSIEAVASRGSEMLGQSLSYPLFLEFLAEQQNVHV